MQVRRISQEQLDALSELAVFQKALQDFGTELSHVFDNRVIAKNPLHATLLDNTLDILALLASGAERAHALEDQFRKSWERDLKVLQEAIVSLIPEWYDTSREKILSNRPLVEKFLSMFLILCRKLVVSSQSFELSCA